MVIMSYLLNILGFVLYPLIAFLIAMSLTAVCIKVLPKLGFIDNPGGRHIHERVVPRGGGVAIALAVLFTVLTRLVSSHDAAGLQMLLYASLPGGIIIVTGLVDDRIGLKSRVKLLLQIAAAALVWYGWHRSGQEFAVCGFVLPWQISLGVTVLWIVGVINAFNMVDGLDGLATGLAVISGLCLSVWFLFRQDPMALYMLIFVGACLGFLRYNFAPAKIFLGDTGSMFLGLFLAVAGGGTLDMTATFTTLLLPPLIVGVPIFDMVLAVVRRSVRKWLNKGSSGLMDADSDHLHHRLFRKNNSHSKSATRMYVIGMIFASMALLLLLLRDRAATMALIVILLAVLIMLRRLAVIELHDSVSLLRERLSHPRKSLLCMAVHPMLDMVMIGIAAMLSCFLVTSSLRSGFVAISVLPVLLTLALAGNYRVFWLRATLADRGKLFFSAAAGCLLSAGILYYGKRTGICPVNGNFAIGVSCFVLLVPMLLSVERFFLHYLESLWYSRFVMTYRRSGTSRMLLIGGGLRCRMAMGFFGSCRRELSRENVIGVLDDDPQLAKRNSYDLPVLGQVDDLEKVWNEYKFDRVLITTGSLAAERVDKIREFCRVNGVRCQEFVLKGPGLTAQISAAVEKNIRSIANKWVCAGDVIGLAAAAAAGSWLLWHKLVPGYMAVVAGVTLLWMVCSGVPRVWWMRAGIGNRWKLLKSTVYGGVAGHALFGVWLICSGQEFAEIHFCAVTLIFILFISLWTQLFRLIFHPLVYCRRSAGQGERILIFGGGLFCRIYVQACCFLKSPEAATPVGVIDDDTVLHGLQCHGLPVLGGCDALEEIYRKYPFDRILIATDRISGTSLSAISKFALAHRIPYSNFQILLRDL
ncbi:MAG: hypothetical protein E7041_09370 [Lentisphaerae bacterium]|nr:hypothetical protein [Lentisphaerota bacterium]